MAERSVIRELVTVLGFDVDEKKLKEFDDRVASIKKNLKRAAIAFGIVAGSITAMVIKTTLLGNNLAKTARRLGFSIERLQEYRFAFDQAGVSAQTFDMAVQRFGRRAAEAAKGTGEAVKALHELGIQLKENDGNLRSLDILLMESLDALGERSDEIDRNRLAMKLFDSEGVRLVQGLSEGNKKLKEQMQLFRETGAVMDEETAKAAENLVNEWGFLKAAILGVVVTVGKQLIPMVTSAVKAISGWIKSNRTLAIVIGAVILALVTLSGIGFTAIAMITLMKLKLVVLNTTVGALLVKILLIPAAILSIVAVVGLLIQDIAKFATGGGESVIGLLWDGIKMLGSRIAANVQAGLAWLWDRAMMFKDWLFELPAQFSALVRKELDKIRDVLPKSVQGVLGVQRVENVVPLSPLANVERLRQEGSLRSTQNEVNVTVNAAPGQSPEAIAGAVVNRMGLEVNRFGLMGLGK